MTSLRWGLLGTARINRAVIAPLRASARNQLAAVASRDAAKAAAYAAEWQIPRALGSYEALLADPEIDVVYISLPNNLHVEWTVKALQAGKHVLCEKPLGLRLADVDALIAAARASGRVVMEAFMYRHHPQTLRVKELVDAGAIGRLQVVRGAFSFNLTRTPDVRLQLELGGGALWDVGCYPVSYARYLAGAEPLEVFGQQWTGRGGVDEAFVGQLRFPGDVFGQFDCAFRSPLRAHIEVVGSAGTLDVPAPYKPGLNERISLRRDEAEPEVLVTAGQELYLGEVENMADAILDGKPTRVSLADSRANTAVLLALYESARRGQPVAVEPQPAA